MHSIHTYTSTHRDDLVVSYLATGGETGPSFWHLFQFTVGLTPPTFAPFHSESYLGDGQGYRLPAVLIELLSIKLLGPSDLVSGASGV